jgi:predicted tellurium resistance membrane protein TerC
MDYLLSLLTDPTAWVALLMLIAMEVVLGIDNLIFISILTNKLPEQERVRARRLGISAALIMRLALLGTAAVIARLREPVVTLLGQDFSWRDMILIAGGLFLVWKATKEIHHSVDPDPGPDIFEPKKSLTAAAAIGQIIMLDAVFSIDSIITAVGMTNDIPVMVIAIVVTVGVMFFAATPLANFINANPTIVMLALAFLLLIGMTLIADGFGVHVPKGYIYAAMDFAGLTEGLNMLSRRAKTRARSAGD